MRNIRLAPLAICLMLWCCGEISAQAPVTSLLPKPAPAFERLDLAGKKVRLEDYRGKVVLLNFWATWCAPCKVELPRFAEWQTEYGARGLQVLAVSMDDHAAPVRRTARKMHLDFPVVMGDARLGEDYGGVLGLPVTYLVNRNGFVVARVEGGTDLKALENAVLKLLDSR